MRAEEQLPRQDWRHEFIWIHISGDSRNPSRTRVLRINVSITTDSKNFSL